MSETITNYESLIDLFNSSEEGRRHIHFFAAIPDDLIPYLPGFWWDQSVLFALELEGKSVGVDDLVHFLDVPIWRSTEESSLFTVTGRQILESPQNYANHWKRIQAADLSYPIMLYERDDHSILLDGYHRLHRAIHEGMSHIRASYLYEDQIKVTLVEDGFLGELNAAALQDPDFIVNARIVARELLASDQSNLYPVWR